MDATSVVSAWNAILIQLCYVFTEPTAHVWRQIALGWVLHRGPATVTGIYRTLGDLADRRATLETYKEQLAALESSARPSPKDRERMTELSFEIPEMETAMRDAEQAIGKHLPSDSQPDEAHDDDGPGNPFLFVSEHIWQGVTVRIDDRFAVFDKELKGPVKLCIKRIPGERFIVAINPTTGTKLQRWSSEVLTPASSAR